MKNSRAHRTMTAARASDILALREVPHLQFLTVNETVNMKQFRVHIAVVLVVLATLVAVLVLATKTSQGQSQGVKQSPDGSSSLVKPNSMVRDARPDSGRPTALAPVVARNLMLRNELSWTFGGKQQRGWYLYTSLIGRLIGTEHDSGSEGFAADLKRWQEKAGLSPSGVLDQDSLYAMVSEWQGNRLKDRSYPPADKLVTVPSTDFYDPERVDELRQVERETYAAYKRMVAAAAADRTLGLARNAHGELAPTEKYLKIISSFRTREYQDRLRRQSPHAGRAGLAVNSPHFSGRALDIYVGGEPVETKDSNRAVQVQSRVYQWLVNNAERFGFRPYYYEPWHWEYVGLK
jgi:uncharacterized protein YcbK (DUF882 family)